jgi:hypothetical protein
VTIKHGSPFNGKLKSAVDACEAKRKVTLFRKAPKDKIGSSKSKANGKWKVGKSHPEFGRYFAKAKKKTLGDGTICKGGRSRTVNV